MSAPDSWCPRCGGPVRESICPNCSTPRRPGHSFGGKDDGNLSFKDAKGKVISSFERQYIEALLREHGNDISAAAREAGIDRKDFQDLLRKHGIAARPDDDDGEAS